jgi:hypothetical protein
MFTAVPGAKHPAAFSGHGCFLPKNKKSGRLKNSTSKPENSGFSKQRHLTRVSLEKEWSLDQEEVNNPKVLLACVPGSPQRDQPLCGDTGAPPSSSPRCVPCRFCILVPAFPAGSVPWGRPVTSPCQPCFLSLYTHSFTETPDP